ncbi:MAG: Uma2 family endonuclease [Leptolyngbyaceae cyanobacterium MAG.088]|nr:Uma2 family endonuclease [Leptolyngbyaceae cyanobacterium MAG.088]
MIAIPHYISPEEYLALERQSSIRHEYRQGLVYAMAGGTDNHERIAFNLLKIIDNHLGDASDCRFHAGNVKVNYVDEFYYYPDAFVTCDARDREDRYIKRYPKLIVEVLSPSTEVFHRGDKFEDYQQVDSLEEYVLIAQGSQQVECQRRTVAGVWEKIIYERNDTAVLSSIGLEFAVAELYRGIEAT